MVLSGLSMCHYVNIRFLALFSLLSLPRLTIFGVLNSAYSGTPMIKKTSEGLCLAEESGTVTFFSIYTGLFYLS